jgi:aryl-alcohol dehydrogenase-like predicted oxidoreductase
MKIILGGAQFAQRYGIYNKRIINFKELKKTINFAKKNKIFIVDTSFNYKNSHRIIGALNIHNLKIITKLKLKDKKQIDCLDSQIKDSLKELKIKKYFAILIHDYKDLLSKAGKNLLNELYKLKKNGLVDKIGVSIYSPNDLKIIWQFWKPEIVQGPLNVFDKRIHDSGWLSKLKKNKIIFIARSVFLQGALLQNIDKYSKYLNNYKNQFNFWFNWCKKNKISQIQACLDYIKKFKEIDYAIVGFNSYIQFKETLSSYKKKKYYVPDIFNSKKIKLIDPRKWKLK